MRIYFPPITGGVGSAVEAMKERRYAYQARRRAAAALKESQKCALQAGVERARCMDQELNPNEMPSSHNAELVESFQRRLPLYIFGCLVLIAFFAWALFSMDW